MGAFDCVGGEVARAVVAATNPGAQTLIYGALGGPTLQLNTLDIFLNKKIQVVFGYMTSILSDVFCRPVL